MLSNNFRTIYIASFSYMSILFGGCGPQVVVVVPEGFEGVALIVHQKGTTSSGSWMMDTVMYIIPENGVLCVSTPQIVGAHPFPLVYEGNTGKKQLELIDFQSENDNNLRYAAGGVGMSQAGSTGLVRATVFYVGTINVINNSWNSINSGTDLGKLCDE